MPLFYDVVFTMIKIIFLITSIPYTPTKTGDVKEGLEQYV